MDGRPTHSGDNGRGLRYALRKLHYEYALLFSRFEHSLNVCNIIIGSLTVLCSICCIVILIVYLGYDLSPKDALTLRHVLRVIQMVYGVNIVYKFVFVYRTTVRHSRIIMWIVDIGVILSLFMWLSPHQDNGLEPVWVHTLHSYKSMFVALGAYSLVEICYGLSRIPGRRTNPSLLLALSFVVFIIIGSFVLMLPRCTYHGISYFDSLFVASSAVSITGLTTVDVYSTFTPFGILVLSVLIQLGSLGIITFTSFFALFFTGNTSIYNQLLLRDVIYSKSMNVLIPTLLYVLGFTVAIELIGAVGVYFTIPDSLGMDIEQKLMFATFHSMSSFCNAGFSYLPDGMANPLLMRSNQSIYIVTSLLVFAGGIGFPLLVNLKEIMKSYIKKWLNSLRLIKGYKMPVHVFDLNTKIVLVTTLSILCVGSILFFVFESGNTMRGMSLYQRVVQSVFNSLIPRSAGFASVNPANFLNVTLLVVILQMIVGGSSQSMAGGIKVNTLGAVMLNLRSVLFGHEGTTAFNRTINRASVRRANAVVVVAALSLTLYAVTVLLLEPELRGKDVVFETVSALFTVGSSLGITSQLCDTSKVVLSTAMFLGRVGILSLLCGLVVGKRDYSEHLPVDNIIIS